MGFFFLFSIFPILDHPTSLDLQYITSTATAEDLKSEYSIFNCKEKFKFNYLIKKNIFIEKFQTFKASNKSLKTNLDIIFCR